MKIKIAIITFVIASIISFIFFSKNTKTDLFVSEIVDSVHKSQINPLFQTADAAKYAQNYKKADSEFKKLISQSLSTADSQYVLNQLIFINLTMNQDSAAQQWLRIFEHTSPPLSIAAQADYHFNMGTWAYHTFKPKMAEQYLRLALVEYLNIYGEKHLKTAACLTQLGLVNYDFVQVLDTISHHLLRAYDIYQSAEHLIPFSAQNEFAMGLNSFMNRNHEIAQAHFDNAIHIAQLAPFKDTLLIARSMSYRGHMLKKKAETTKDTELKKKLLNDAESAFESAIVLCNNSSDAHTQELYRNNLLLYIFTQDSVKFNQKLDKLNRIVAQNHDYFAFEDRLRGYYHFNKKDSSRTIAYYKSFLKKHYDDSICSPALKDEAFFLLIRTYNQSSQFDSSIAYISFWTTNGKKNNIDLDNYDKVLNSSAIHNHFVPLNQLGFAYLNKYKHQKNIADLKKAVKAYILADSFMFKHSNGDGGNTALTFQLNVGRDLYHNAIEAVYELYAKTGDSKLLNSAFIFCERMKSSILFRDISLQSNNDSIKNLKYRFDKLLGEYELESANNYARSSLLTKTSRQLDAIIKNNKVSDSIKIPTLSTIQRNLTEGYTVIEYYSGQPTFALFISRTKILFHKIESDSLTKHLEVYRSGLSEVKLKDIKSSQYAFSNSAYALYNLLLKPFEKELNKQKELVIIPDKDLHNIPFESFITDTQWKSYKSTSYLVKKNYVISYAPSWKIYARGTSQPLKNNYKAICFSYGEGKSDLACSQNEVNAISTTFGKGSVTEMLDKNCSKENFIKEWQIGHYDILHLSLHAKGNLKNIFDNKILFSNDGKDFLYGFDLSGKTSNISLIVLSACETGVGNAASVEGAYSISRYFFQAGAKTVLASLWQIDDCQSATILESFYQNLKNGQKPHQALYNAKRSFLSNSQIDEMTAYPSFWAGLICLE